jgi:hypothetical protein
MAGTIEYIAPVENASGKIFGKKSRFVAVKRNWGHRRKGCSVTGQRNLKDHPYTSAETATKSAFAAVSAAVRARLADASQQAADQAAFRAQTKYDTLYRYIWNDEWTKYKKP